MKKLFYFYSIFIAVSFLSCSDETSNEEIDDAISFSLQLCNIDGNAENVFKSGDNVVFDLIITNNSDYDISYGLNNTDIDFGDDLFCVYSEAGSCIGLPWTGMYCEYTGQKSFIIPANTVKHIYCPWNLCDEVTCSHPLCKAENKEPLPVGEYFTKFSIKVNKNVGLSKKLMTTKSFHIHFKVQ